MRSELRTLDSGRQREDIYEERYEITTTSYDTNDIRMDILL